MAETDATQPVVQCDCPCDWYLEIFDTNRPERLVRFTDTKVIECQPIVGTRYEHARQRWYDRLRARCVALGQVVDHTSGPPRVRRPAAPAAWVDPDNLSE